VLTQEKSNASQTFNLLNINIFRIYSSGMIEILQTKKAELLFCLFGISLQ